MSGTDVRELAKESLPQGKFPADPRADFRLHIAPGVRRGIEQHAKADASVEVCGVLVGRWEEDEAGPYAVVTDYIRCDSATSKFAEVTFTHESWAHINKEMDSRFVDARIVGWYHSHPDFGIFLSERDCFIHEHFFAGPGQVAYVIDPVRDLEGAFAWQNGKPTPLPHFWIGDRIRTVDASERNVAAEMAARLPAGADHALQFSDRASPRTSSLSFAMILLGWLAVFVIGYLYGGWRSSWEQQMIIEGAVAHFADTKLIREGLEEELAAVRSRLGALAAELEKLPEPNAELSDEEQELAAKRRTLIQENMALCEAALGTIEQRYGLSDYERAVLAQIAAQKQAELRRMMEDAKKAAGGGKNEKTGNAKGTAPKPNAEQRKAPNEPAAEKTQQTGDAPK